MSVNRGKGRMMAANTKKTMLNTLRLLRRMELHEKTSTELNLRNMAMQVKNKRKCLGQLLVILVGVVTLNAAATAQGINYPVGSPTGTSGAGNARTDPDNLFIRNNVAGMTEIPINEAEELSGKLGVSANGHWRFLGEFQLATYQS